MATKIQELGRAVVKAPNSTTMKNVEEWKKHQDKIKQKKDSEKKGLGFNPFVEALKDKE